MRQKWTIEWNHNKAKNMVCAPSEDSVQPTYPRILIRVFAVLTKELWVMVYLKAQSTDSNQTAWLHRLVWVCWAHMSFCRFWHIQTQFWCMISVSVGFDCDLLHRPFLDICLICLADVMAYTIGYVYYIISGICNTVPLSSHCYV